MEILKQSVSAQKLANLKLLTVDEASPTRRRAPQEPEKDLPDNPDRIAPRPAPPLAAAPALMLNKIRIRSRRSGDLLSSIEHLD